MVDWGALVGGYTRTLQGNDRMIRRLGRQKKQWVHCRSIIKTWGERRRITQRRRRIKCSSDDDLDVHYLRARSDFRTHEAADGKQSCTKKYDEEKRSVQPAGALSSSA